ncbi:MAG: beta galactosidase jelly roll domain-containing protein, partial [Victivallales bacterium]|nr:beta galactosidase jelly roll domain-containing protein [Victivallales bacterium]
WHTVDYDESQWETIPTDRPWDKSGYATYDGYGWYRLRVTLPEKMPGEPILMVGSADEACDIWINGQKVLHRPYPFEGNTNSWNEAFNVPFGDVAHSGENIIAIRVEDNNGQGGLTKRCFLKFLPNHGEKNALRNANFEDGTDQWKLVQRYGVNKATTMQFDGRNALCCEVVTPSPNTLYSNKYRNYLMLHQTIAKLVKGKKYLVTVEFRTSPDYDGVMMVFCHADVQRERQSESNIQLGHSGPMTQWATLSKPFIANMDNGDFYLNYVCNKGKLYFSSVSIREVE